MESPPSTCLLVSGYPLFVVPGYPLHEPWYPLDLPCTTMNTKEIALKPALFAYDTKTQVGVKLPEC